MAFEVLARKWRPPGFSDLIGQEQVVRTLVNALEQGRVAHAYLFAGVRGTGKTSTARILARALNCTRQDSFTAQPCGECNSCREILDGSDLDLHEIDAASHTGVDNVRELIESVRYAPVRNRFKVFIIDEVHMLSTAAFNALLKTLEEPPAYVVFVLATTELHKIPATILSRCQHFPFRRLENREILDRLAKIVAEERIETEDGALEIIAQAGEGSVRDALSVLDQAITYGSGSLRRAEVEALLGRLERRHFRRIMEAVLNGSPADVISAVRTVSDSGADPRTVFRDLEREVRELLLASIGLDNGSELAELAADRSYEELLRLHELMLREDGFVRRADDPVLAIELVLLKARELEKLRPIEEILAAFPPASPPQDRRSGSESSATSGQARRSAPREKRARPRQDPDDSSEEAPAPTEDFDAPPPDDDVPFPDDPYPNPPSPDPVLPPRSSSDRFLERLRDASPRLAGFVRLADRVELSESHLSIIFGPSHAAARDVLESRQSRSELARLARETTGQPIEVRVDLAEPEGGDLSATARDADARELAQDRLASKVYADPMVQKALEIFRGEITEINPHEEQEP